MSGKKIKTSAQLLSKIKELSDQKLGSRDIARQLNVTRYAVQKAWKELGLYRHVTKQRVIKNKKCKQCEVIMSISHFRKRTCFERVFYESYCAACEAELRKVRQKDQYQNNKNWYVEYRKTNKDKINKYKRDVGSIRALVRAGERYADEPSFKIRVVISSAIRKSIKNNGSVKKGSSLAHLLYTMVELKDHIESQFEPWMSWNNWNQYNPETWDDNDISTWCWNLDHIIPASTFTYTSMEDPAFRDCWALSNLRPLSAKQNVLDGSARTRHI